ncbi:D-alanine--D-alanine ligase [Flavobacterium sp. MXW15]|uniref:D-alanine--D-alanine ligase n=1 Tax=Xanthomonas chitinilytica TaxID=2989819 RepID=A0ABT3JSM0_9XANT|nr:D-alanine--D-alanine ligase [Xanthomonas sp. H13-6]MCW4454196.1 D-alanine--D-alanine ligase [Flavobacterium sp. MXW15]MCW4471430.1 D-alanine--D-alanine ligase [Xanthomonas sp. H13-6]
MSQHAFPPLRTTDPAAFGRVAVLLGGTSSEREVSLDSGRNVLEALRARGVEAVAVDGIPALAEGLAAQRFDRVFNILHGHNGGGEDGIVQGLMEAFGVPYTGSRVLGSALSMDKIRTKQVWLSLGLPTPRFVALAPAGDAHGCASAAAGRTPGAADAHGCASAAAGRMPGAADVHAAARELGLPVVLKPANEGSSVGISRVLEESQLDDAVALAVRYDGQLLMEQMVVGDELTVAILGDVALPSIRIVPRGQWYDYDAKYIAEDTQYLCPGLEGGDEAEIGRLALAAFRAAGCGGWGRVDVMRDRASGRFFLLEVNTAPGMTSHSLVPKAARQAGIGFEELVWRVLEQTLDAEDTR